MQKNNGFDGGVWIFLLLVAQNNLLIPFYFHQDKPHYPCLEAPFQYQKGASKPLSPQYIDHYHDISSAWSGECLVWGVLGLVRPGIIVVTAVYGGTGAKDYYLGGVLNYSDPLCQRPFEFAKAVTQWAYAMLFR